MIIEIITLVFFIFLCGIPIFLIYIFVADKYDEHKGEKDLKATYLCNTCNSENVIWYKIGTRKGTVLNKNVGNVNH